MGGRTCLVIVADGSVQGIVEADGVEQFLGLSHHEAVDRLGRRESCENVLLKVCHVPLVFCTKSRLRTGIH